MQSAMHIYITKYITIFIILTYDTCCTPQKWFHKLFKGDDISIINYAINHHFSDNI